MSRVINVEEIIGEENNCAIIIVNSSKNHECMLKLLGKRLKRNRTLTEFQSIPS